MIAKCLGLVREIIGVHADAVTANQARPERQEIPFGRSGIEDLVCVDAHPLEDDRQLVDQRDVEIALGILDHLGGFGDHDVGRNERPGINDLAIEGIDPKGGFGRGPRRHFAYIGKAMLLVARIDPLGRISNCKVLAEPQA